MINVGVIGCGKMAEKHVRSLLKLKHYAIIAISDLSQERMEIIRSLMNQDKVSDVKMYKNYEMLLLDERIQFVIIATSSNQHAPMAKKVILQKKHVLVEKPLSLSLQESRELIQLSDQLQVQLFVGHQLRYRQMMMEVKSIIDLDKLGEIYYGSVSMYLQRPTAYFEEARWRGTWEEDGGMLINQGIHLIDLLLWFIGDDASSIYGNISNVRPQKQTEDISFGILTFTNGAKGLIEANIITYPQNHSYAIRLFGEKGTIILEGNQLENIASFNYRGMEAYKQEELKEKSTDRDEHVRMYENIYRSLLGERPNLIVDGKEGMKALETIFALYSSHLNKKTVDLPLSTFSTTMMEYKNNPIGGNRP